MQKPLFIALEGIDGSGKSTQTKLLAERLKNEGHKVYTTFEPTDAPIGRMIRSIMKGEMKADNRVVAALFAADRLDHLLNETDGLLKKLKDGYSVITDRYYFSSYAYHGAYMPLDWVIAINAQAAELLRPDLNVYIDVNPETSLGRINKGRTSTELYETSETLHSVRNTYLEVMEKLKDQEKIARVDGNGSEQEVAEGIWKAVQGRLWQKT